MNFNLKRGSIFLFLLLLLSLSGFILIKVIVKREGEENAANWEIASTASFRYTLAQHLGSPNDWKTYKNSEFKFQIKYPDHWKTQENTLSGPGILGSYEAYISDKVKMAISVRNFFQIPESGKEIKIGDNKYLILGDTQDIKKAILKKGNYYYLIEFTQNRFFANDTEFKSAFYQILKNFAFTNSQSQAGQSFDAKL